MGDIAMQMPWACDEKDCEAQWHLASYWMHTDGTVTMDSYTDGDHDPIDDFPTGEEHDAAWKEYNQYVAMNGEDPLDQFMVKGAYEQKQYWEVNYGPSILGMVLLRWRRGDRGRWQFPNTTEEQLPDAIRDYFLLEGPAHRLRVPYDPDHYPNPAGFEKFLRDAGEKLDIREPYNYRGIVVGATVEVKVPRSKAAYRRELRRAARRK